MERWEYKFVVVDQDRAFFGRGGKFDPQAASTDLNRLGADGWEVVSSFDMNAANGVTRDVVFLLKRPLARNS